MNGKAIINFSTILGYPDDVHFKPWQSKRNPSKVPRKKSANKIKRDNERAARFQARKRKEEEEADSAASVPPSEVEASSTSFHFSKPLPENFRGSSSSDTDNTMMHTSLYFSRIEDEEGGQDRMESSSIFDQFPVTLGDSEKDEVTVEGESKVSRATDQTAAGKEEDCLEEEEGAAAVQAAEGRKDESRTKEMSRNSEEQLSAQLSEIFQKLQAMTADKK